MSQTERTGILRLNQKQMKPNMPSKIPRSIPFILIALSIGTAVLLIPTEVVNVEPRPTTRTERRTSTVLSIETGTTTGVETRTSTMSRTTTVTDGLWFGYTIITEVIRVPWTMTYTSYVAKTTVLELLWTKTEIHTTSTTVTQQKSLFGGVSDILDVLAKIFSIVSGIAGIASFITRQRGRPRSA